jgi:hypothetical protein
MPLGDILTPDIVVALENMKQCEVDILKSLQKHNCFLSTMDTMIDGRLFERRVMPMPKGSNAAEMWQVYLKEEAHIKGMIVAPTKH